VAEGLPEHSTETDEAVAKFLTQFEGARRLTPNDLVGYKSNFCAGWEIPDLCTDSARKLRILLPAPTSAMPVRVAVHPAPPVLAWPHLEAGGLLCLPTAPELTSVGGILDAIPRLLEDARILVNVSAAELNVQDFEDEFTSYWTRWDRTNAALNLVCEPRGPSREIAVWHSTEALFAAEDEASLRAWLANRFREPTPTKAKCVPASLIWLPRALRPSEYPTTVAALRVSLNENPSALAHLDAALLRAATEPKLVVLGMPTRKGVAFAGLCIHKPAGITRGFPPKRVPDDWTLSRYSAGRIDGASVTRLDHAWIHGRDHNADAAVLRVKRVAVMGVGAVGSGVADLLAKAGIGKMLLYDPEMLESANSSRHLLGVPAAGAQKSKAVAQEITRRLPHLCVTAFGAFAGTPAIIESLQAVDLIVSMTGDWPTEYLLDAIWVANGALPPILYGWMEPHAAAGHALAFKTRERCLRCVLDDQGRARIAVTAWPLRTTADIPACGGTFQPYGAAELAQTHALIADLVIDLLMNRTKATAHRVWIGPQDHVKRAGGAWEPRWIAAYGDPAEGGRLAEVPISPCDKCRAS
jgi:molybdopterin/thiamine biosynthesis adenylyltransferase